jgi:hypothetical protein
LLGVRSRLSKGEEEVIVASRKVRRHEALKRDEGAPVSEKTRRRRTLRDLPSYADRQDELVTNPVILLTQRATALPPPQEEGASAPSLDELATLARGSAPPPRITIAPRLLAPVAPIGSIAVAPPTLVPPVATVRQPSSLPAFTVSNSSAPARPSTSPPRRRAGDDEGRARGLGTIVVSATVGAIVALGMWMVRSGLDRVGSGNDNGPFAAATASAADDKCVTPASAASAASTAAVSTASTPESEKPVSFDALPRAYGDVSGGTTRAASHRSATTVTSRTSAATARETPAPAARSAVQRARVSPRTAVTDAVQRASFAARSCESGPQNGKVEVTFSPTGAVSSVALIKGFDDAGVNGCVLRAFGRVRVSPFEGDPITVRKTVSW